jgi:CDP-diacylglycerol--glycerol-3-phosphate 3-phosphatidyltransferase
LAVLPQQPRGLLILRDSLTWLAVALTLYSGLSYLWIALPGLRQRA